MSKRMGRLRLGVVSGGEHGSFVRLEMTDVESRTRALVIDMTIEQFGYLLARQMEQDLEYDMFTKYIGSRREHKTESIPITEDVDLTSRDRVNVARELLRPYEVDGWMGSTDDMTNWHRRGRRGGIMYADVSFVRYVNIETGEPVV